MTTQELAGITSLRELRKQTGIAPKEVAAHMGVSVRTLYTWENGERQMTIATMKQLCELYRVDLTIHDMYRLIPSHRSALDEVIV